LKLLERGKKMNNKEYLSKVAQDTIAILDSGKYTQGKQTIEIKSLIEKAVNSTILYSPLKGEKLLKEIELENSFQTLYEVTNETTLKAAKRLLEEEYENIVALNFASAKNPGGGFLKGSTAQEESLARSSALYYTLIQNKEMYDYNKKIGSGLYSDYMIYSPKVPVIKDDLGNLLESPYTCSFITSPAVNVNALKQEEKPKIRITMKTRIEKILAIALEHKNEAIVLGAFGCGVFGNRAVDIAQIFKQVLNDVKFKGKFKKVTFAVYDNTPNKEIFNVFKNTFR
jgi:uncharacterized protein (TIGR02452 family)